MKDFFKSLQFIFRPKFWTMNYQYDKDWDVEFNRLLDEHTFSDISSHECTAKLGDTEIWVANYPFVCFKALPFTGLIGSNIRPSRLTILRAKKVFDRDKLRLQIEECVYPPRSQRMEELEIETLDMLRASNHKNDIMGDTIIKKHKFK
jgi:hypothetical protein